MSQGIKVAGRGFALQDSAYVDGIASGNNASYATLIAHAGGGQAAATPMPPNAMIINLGTVATGGDSVVLPFALAGTIKMVFNSTAASANIFGQVSANRQTGVIDTINGVASSTAYALAAGARAIFFCGANGAWAALTG